MKKYSNHQLNTAAEYGRHGSRGAKHFLGSAEDYYKKFGVTALDGSVLPPEAKSRITNEWASFMAVGARLKRNKYIIVGVVIGVAGTYAYMTYKNRKAKKVIVHEVRSY